jgi:hypothetical protein
VHIVTFRKNYEAAMANGDYHKANVPLVAWADIAPETQRVLWSKKLRGQVCNAEEFRPKAAANTGNTHITKASLRRSAISIFLVAVRGRPSGGPRQAAYYRICAAFALIVLMIGIKRYRQTLD